MFRNYLLSIWRNFRRNRLFTSLNISGLVIGMTACLLIGQFVLHELSYDAFWPNADRVFRVQQDRFKNGELTTRWAAGCVGIGADLKENFPEVECYVRLYESTALMSATGVDFIREPGVYYAGQDFFKVFGVSLLKGVDSTALKEPNHIVLSEMMAKKYFGTEDPMGKTIMNKKVPYVVSGVFADLPYNTHMKLEALQSFATFVKLIGRRYESQLTSWGWDGYHTYVLLSKGARGETLQAKLPSLVEKRNREFPDDQENIAFNLQSIKDIHLDSNFIGEFKPNGNRDTVYFLTVVAALILIIAWINYINLSTAKSVERAREVGVRKVMGGYRRELIQQFLTESLVLNILAMTLSVTLAIVLVPWFNQLTSRNLGVEMFQQQFFWVGVVVLIFLGALLSGLYPAFILSGFRPVEVLKGKFRSAGRGNFFRKGMVVIQFVASVTLIVGTFTVYRQMTFLRNQQLGVNLNQTVVLWSPNNIDSTFEDRYQVFKERISRHAEVTKVCASSSVPGSAPDFNAGGIRRISQRPEESNQYRVIEMDEDYISSFGLQVIAGRPFAGGPAERGNIILNEAAARLMGFSKVEDAINDRIYFWGDTFKIVGVVKNYRHESSKKDYDQMLFQYRRAPEGYYSIRLNTSRVKESMESFTADWKENFPGNPFDYFFLDEAYNNQYKADEQFGQIFGVFAGLAIFIACLGLFGLSSLTAIQRTKEIGVRKVLGATVPGILMLIGKEYLVLLIISMAMAIPASWGIMNDWLSGFANRIPLSVVIFAIPCFVVAIIALGTVMLHTLRAAQTNPVKALRYE